MKARDKHPASRRPVRLVRERPGHEARPASAIVAYTSFFVITCPAPYLGRVTVGDQRVGHVDLGNGTERTNALTGHVSAGSYAMPWLGVGVEVGAGLNATQTLRGPHGFPSTANLSNVDAIRRAWHVSVMPVLRLTAPGLPVYLTGGFGYARGTAQETEDGYASPIWFTNTITEWPAVLLGGGLAIPVGGPWDVTLDYRHERLGDVRANGFASGVGSRF